MNKVIIRIDTNDEVRASEIIADLRNVVEVIYFPMKMVGFWDSQGDIHLCTENDQTVTCAHKLPKTDNQYVDYAYSLQRECQANLEIVFPHAQITLYLA